MKIEIEIPDQDIIDILTTALEGGSNYWYYLPDLSMLADSDEYLEDRIFNACVAGGSIPVHGIETDEYLGEINLENIIRGIKLFIKIGTSEHTLDPTMDANDADILFQYTVMGEVVYG